MNPIISVDADAAAVVHKLPARAGPRDEGDRVGHPRRAEGRRGRRGRRDRGAGHGPEVRPLAQGHARRTGKMPVTFTHFFAISDQNRVPKFTNKKAIQYSVLHFTCLASWLNLVSTSLNHDEHFFLPKLFYPDKS